jgi:acyl-CoA synthetase (AMP-forming)/AMP-acid ligase II
LVQLEYIVTFLAINWARAIAAPLNSNYETEEFKFYLEDAQSKLLVLPTSGNTKAEAAAKDRGVPTATFAFPKGLSLWFKLWFHVHVWHASLRKTTLSTMTI